MFIKISGKIEYYSDLALELIKQLYTLTQPSGAAAPEKANVSHLWEDVQSGIEMGL